MRTMPAPASHESGDATEAPAIRRATPAWNDTVPRGPFVIGSPRPEAVLLPVAAGIQQRIFDEAARASSNLQQQVAERLETLEALGYHVALGDLTVDFGHLRVSDDTWTWTIRGVATTRLKIDRLDPPGM